MITILVDYHLEGKARRLWSTLSADGWVELVETQFVTLAQVGLPATANDRAIWRYVQAQGMLLLTGNRNMKGDDSLEQTLREENMPTSLPVLTVGTPERLDEHDYRVKCAERLTEVVLYLERYRGVGRLFIP